MQLQGKVVRAELTKVGGVEKTHFEIQLSNGCLDGRITCCKECAECWGEEFYVGRELYVEIEAVPLP